MKSKRGFTLIELLVTISIIGTLVGLIVNNLADARARARDTKKKQNLQALKTALRLYYNDYQTYPLTGNGSNFVACGPDGDEPCPYGCGADWTAGGVDGCATIYMKELVETDSGYEFEFRPCDGEDFRAKVVLENASDADILTSQNRCPASDCGLAAYDDTDYIVCAD
jgi:prepilin-type N-terminal cleavage/methylation domain-containing protein